MASILRVCILTPRYRPLCTAGWLLQVSDSQFSNFFMYKWKRQRHVHLQRCQLERFVKSAESRFGHCEFSSGDDHKQNINKKVRIISHSISICFYFAKVPEDCQDIRDKFKCNRAFEQVMMWYISIFQFSEEVETELVEESCDNRKGLNVEVESKRYFPLCAFAFENVPFLFLLCNYNRLCK